MQGRIHAQRLMKLRLNTPIIAYQNPYAARQSCQDLKYDVEHWLSGKYQHLETVHGFLSPQCTL